MSPPSVTLPCRLLCACGCAYAIDPVTGRYQPPPGDRQSAVVGWLGAPVPISGGDDEIDACLVGENADGVIVAFRGTLSPSWQSQASVLESLRPVPARRSAPQLARFRASYSRCRTATPGRVLPSSHSRKAPPAVEA